MSWPNLTIGEVCLPTMQCDPALTGKATFLYIDISSIDRDRKEIVEANSILAENAPSRARKIVQVGDVLVSTVRPNLNAAAQVPVDLDGQVASTGFTVLRANPRLVNARYLFYRITHSEFVDYLIANATGASYPAVSDAIVRRAPLPLPPLSEQERIVELLDEADRLRKLRREADEKAARILPALFLKVFGDPATNPMGWPIKQIGELATLVTSGSTPRGGAEVYVTAGPLFVRSQNVLMGRLDLSDAVRITEVTHSQMLRTRLIAGDVLLNITGASIGRVAWVRELGEEANVNQHVCIIRPDVLQVHSSYLSLCLSLPHHQAAIGGVQAGASRQALNHVQVRALKVAVPPIELQNEFSAKESEANRLTKLLSESGEMVESLFRVLIKKAFSSQLTIKWRQDHTNELLAEMAEQARLLNLPVPQSTVF